ncbi:kelch-like protein 34 [Pristis pectinata]|uniref:kelch-like protein 34 n=1 Tax=Pristis pectinata TaxID=685728 RepID=UPI00223DD7DD|nr:kelch-like protein 34 [Pristis pectinata]
MSYFLALSSTHGEAVVSRYRALRDEKLLCDVVLVAEGTEFRAHRSLLACASDYFRCLFKAHTREAGAAVVQLQLVSAGGLGRVLDFIYSSCLALCPDSLEQTLEAASYLQVPEALRLCSVYLASSLSTAGCCRSANLASGFALPEARRRADLYIATNLWRLLELGAERSGLADLNPDSLGAVLDSERLPGVPEPALLGLALDWLGRGPEPDPERWSHADRLLSRIRYGLVPCAELQRLLLHGGQGAAGRAPGARRLITQAVRYHHAEARQPVRQSRQSTLRSGQRQLVAAGGLLLLLERPESGEATAAAARAISGLSALDPRTGCWRPLADGPRVQGHCVCVLGDFLFVLGGELLEEAADQQQHQAGAQAQAGESANSGPQPMPSRRVFRYDPRSNSWSRAANMLKRRAQFACCVLGERIFALGGRCDAGQASLSAAELLDLGGSGRWLEAAELPQRLHGHACAVHAGTIYVSGGRPAGQAEACKEMHSLAPQAGASWQRCPPMTIARFGHQMATVGERIYSFVGMYEPFCDIECYEPLRAQWQRLRPLIFDRSCYGLAVLDDTVYLVGGKKWQQGREVPAQSTVAYDPASDSWREVCRLPVPLYGAQCGALLLPELPDA